MTSSETALRARCWSSTTHEITGRLVLADWLAEHGHERESLEMRIVAEPEREEHYRELAAWYAANGDAARARYMKLCLWEEGSYRKGRCPICDWPLAKSVNEGCVRDNCCFRPNEQSTEWAVRRQNLDRIRQLRELRTTHESRWRKAGSVFVTGPGAPMSWEGDVGGLFRRFTYSESDFTGLSEPVRLRWHNGTIAGVECAWKNVVEQVSLDVDRFVPPHHIWEPTPWARAVITHHPTVRQFVVTGREPTEANCESGKWCWYRAEAMQDPYRLCHAVFQFLLPPDKRGYWVIGFPTRELALAALHSAVADWVRWSVEKGSEK